MQSVDHAGLFENLKQEVNKVLSGRTINRHEDRFGETLITFFPQLFVTNTKKELEIMLKKLDAISIEARINMVQDLSNKA